MGLASKMALAYAVNQGAQVAGQYVNNKPSPYPAAQGAHAPQGGQAASYYQQGPPQQQQQPHPGYQQQGHGGAPSGYNPGYVPQQQHQQQQAYGAAVPMQGGQGGGGSAATNPQLILNTLRQGVQDQNLQAFFPPGSLEQLAQRIAQTGALARIAAEWRLPMEVAMDLARLALVDVQLYIDDSGSMAFEENGSRIDDAKLIVSRVAQAASLFDTDGIQVFFMNSHAVGHGITSEQQAQQLLSTVTFSGLTPLGTSLERKILQPLVGAAMSGALRKPVLVIAVTDGEPASEDRHKIVHVCPFSRSFLPAPLTAVGYARAGDQGGEERAEPDALRARCALGRARAGGQRPEGDGVPQRDRHAPRGWAHGRRYGDVRKRERADAADDGDRPLARHVDDQAPPRRAQLRVRLARRAPPLVNSPSAGSLLTQCRLVLLSLTLLSLSPGIVERTGAIHLIAVVRRGGQRRARASSRGRTAPPDCARPSQSRGHAAAGTRR